MDVISFAGRAIDTLKAIDSKWTRLQPLACARNARCGHRSFLAKAILTMSLGALLSSCSGGGGGCSGGLPVTYTVTASVTGLVGTGLLLQNNGAGNITPTGNGSVVIQSELANGSAYRVSVARQPTKPWQTCAVANGSGVVSQANVTNIAISCTTNSYHIGGSISGVAGAGMTLQLNAGPDLAISADGTFNFAVQFAMGHRAESDAALAHLTTLAADDGASGIAGVHAVRNEADATFQWLDRAYAQKDEDLYLIKGNPLFRNVAHDPRYKAFLRKMNLPD